MIIILSLLLHFNLFYCRIVTHRYIPFEIDIANFETRDSHVYRSWIRGILSHLDNKGYYWELRARLALEKTAISRGNACSHGYVWLNCRDGLLKRRRQIRCRTRYFVECAVVKFPVALLCRWLNRMLRSTRVNKNRCLVTISQFCLTNRRLSILW